MHIQTLTHTHAHTHAQTHMYTHTLSLSLSLSHTHTHTHMYTHTQALGKANKLNLIAAARAVMRADEGSPPIKSPSALLTNVEVEY